MSSIENCDAYRQGKKVSQVPIDEISDVIKDPEIFIWIGIREANDALLLKIEEEFGLHELALEDARKAHQLPKLETYDDSLFLVAKTVITSESLLQFGETHIFFGINFLITIQHGFSTSHKKVRERCENNPHKLALGPGFGLYAILDDIVDHYSHVLVELRERFQTLESGMFEDKVGKLELEQTYELKRELMRLRDAATPIVDICSELMRFHEALLPESLHPYLRDVQDHCKRVINNVDNMREMLMSAMQVNLALVSIGQNDIVRKLAGWGAILAIPTVVFSLYGMNFQVMPELQWRYSYFAVIAFTAIGCGFLYRKLKKSGWL